MHSADGITGMATETLGDSADEPPDFKRCCVWKTLSLRLKEVSRLKFSISQNGPKEGIGGSASNGSSVGCCALLRRRGLRLCPITIKKVKHVFRSCSFRSKKSEQKKDIPDGRTGEPMTNQEREVMYERVADQLAQIADNYEVLSPSPDAAEGGAQGPMTFSFEALLGSTLREKGDRLAENMTEIQPVVSAMTRHVSYNTFSQILSQHLGQEPGWQQVAMMFRLTRSAVQLVGRGTQAALSIKDMTMKYFEDQFAGWVVTQGGWESMVETDLSSEVD